MDQQIERNQDVLSAEELGEYKEAKATYESLLIDIKVPRN